MSILDSNKIITECLSGRIDRVIDRTLADKRLVGAVIKVAIDGELVYSRAAGFADRQLCSTYARRCLIPARFSY